MKNEHIPKHVAIIMDGNGRWAKARKFPALRGHIKGVEIVENIIKVAKKIGVKYLTLFAFSTENWSRSKSEVNNLMNLLHGKIRELAPRLKAEDIRLSVIGDKTGLSKKVQAAIEYGLALTKDCTSVVLNLAINYGGRDEILTAVKRITQDVKDGKLPIEQIEEKAFSKYLYTSNLPDPDLLIRTSGERRISNFLLWQCSYSEFYFTDTFWPDFTEQDFFKSIEEYQKRKRRYGGR